MRERLPELERGDPALDAEIEDLRSERLASSMRACTSAASCSHPRRQQQMGRPDLAQVVHDRALVLGN